MSERKILPIATGRRSAAALGEQARRRKPLVAKAVVATVAASVLAVLTPLLLGRIVDVAIEGRGVILIGLVVALAATALGAGVLLSLASRFSDELGLRLAAGLREQVMDRALQIDAATLEAAGSGDVTSRVTEDVELVNRSAEIAARVFVAAVTVIVTAAGFWSLNWRLALAFCAVFPVYWLALRLFLPTAAARYAVERTEAAARTQTVLTVLRGAGTVRAYGMEERQVATVQQASRQALEAALRAVAAFLKFANMMNAAEAVGLSALLVTGFFGVRQGQLSVGDVTAAALLFHRLFGPLGTLLGSFNDIQQAGAALARLVGVADLSVPPVQPTRPFGRPLGLRADAVSHHYLDGPEVLHQISVAVPAGSSLAVVGASGAGKTTLAAVLGGVFGASSGAVWIGDDPIEALDPDQLRQRVGVVTQEVHSFAGTLAADLRLARPAAADHELLDALRVVGAQDWVAALPAGLQTPIGERGQLLTAEQAQQVALARIVLVDPPIVILDEAAAEAGSAGAHTLERSARATMAGRTAVVVAHRLTQARDCDRIAVLAQGRVIELGTHQELVASRGAYAELWSAWQN